MATTLSEADALVLDLVSRRLHLCDLLGFDDDVDEDEDGEADLWRTAVHESGHTLVALVQGADFVSVEIRERGNGDRGALVNPVVARYPGGSWQHRVAVDVGSAVAEQMVFGNVEMSGVETDLRVALARVYVLRPDRIRSPRHEGVAAVRAEIGRVQRMLGRRRRALMRLAGELQRVRRLTRREAVDVVRSAGCAVRVRPLYSPLVRIDEQMDCDAARRSVERRRHALKRAAEESS